MRLTVVAKPFPSSPNAFRQMQCALAKLFSGNCASRYVSWIILYPTELTTMVGQGVRLPVPHFPPCRINLDCCWCRLCRSRHRCRLVRNLRFCLAGPVAVREHLCRTIAWFCAEKRFPCVDAAHEPGSWDRFHTLPKSLLVICRIRDHILNSSRCIRVSAK